MGDLENASSSWESTKLLMFGIIPLELQDKFNEVVDEMDFIFKTWIESQMGEKFIVREHPLLPKCECPYDEPHCLDCIYNDDPEIKPLIDANFKKWMDEKQ